MLLLIISNLTSTVKKHLVISVNLLTNKFTNNDSIYDVCYGKDTSSLENVYPLHFNNKFGIQLKIEIKIKRQR